MNEYGSVMVAGKNLACSHCGGQSFARRRVMLNTGIMTLPELDWLDRQADVFVCSNCGRLEWFLDPTPLGDTIECPECGEKLPPDVEVCQGCGWTYRKPSDDEP